MTYFSTKNILRAQARSKKAFTLVELLVSIIIFSLMIVALYKSYSSLNMSNNTFKNKSNAIKTIELKKKIIYLDLLLAMPKNLVYLDKDTQEDIISFQTTNSIHKRFNPYVTYIIKDSVLYRLESLSEIKTYPLDSSFNGNIDEFGAVDKFKIYESKNKKIESYLVNVLFKDSSRILLKVNVLSQKV
ncbi:MAG: prepilin-type N-terminal cleavage/methylation domain-containing protein [Sulfurimonas sp.]|nr:prepilin-type N-terminal cleavage/methylation domain-containing protein [Sulfurimonas sp.]